MTIPGGVYPGHYLLKAVTSGSGVLDLGGLTREQTFYVIWGLGTTVGTVILEQAHDKNYAGTWSLLASMAFKDNQVDTFAHTGSVKAVRARISASPDVAMSVFLVAN